MMKRTVITSLTAIMMMAVTPAFAQEENGFKKFNVREDFTENVLDFIRLILPTERLTTRRQRW